MGANQWRDEDNWPLNAPMQPNISCTPTASANSLRGDGTLSTDVPQNEPADHYVYDPANPVPTIGGPLCCDPAHLSAGPRDQRPAEARDDVLVYSTDTLH